MTIKYNWFLDLYFEFKEFLWNFQNNITFFTLPTASYEGAVFLFAKILWKLKIYGSKRPFQKSIQWGINLKLYLHIEQFKTLIFVLNREIKKTLNIFRSLQVYRWGEYFFSWFIWWFYRHYQQTEKSIVCAKHKTLRNFLLPYRFCPFPCSIYWGHFEKLSLYKLNMRPDWYDTVHTARAAKAVQTIRRGHKIMVHWTTTSRTGGLRIRTQIKDIIERSETNWKKVTDDLMLWHFLGITFIMTKLKWRQEWRHFWHHFLQLSLP